MPAKSKIHWFSKYPLGLLCWIARQTTTVVTLAQDFMMRTNGFVDSDWLKASLSEFRSVSSNFLYTIDDMQALALGFGYPPLWEREAGDDP